MCWWPASQPAVIWCWIAHDNSPPLNVHFAYRGLAGLGLGLATLALAQSASAADITTDVQKAVTSVSRDNRVLIIATVLLPVAGWVLFNISGPALNQINNMSNKQKNIARRARGVAGRAFMSRVCILHKRSLSDQIRSSCHAFSMLHASSPVRSAAACSLGTASRMGFTCIFAQKDCCLSFQCRHTPAAMTRHYCLRRCHWHFCSLPHRCSAG